MLNGTEILGKIAKRIIKHYMENNIELEAGPNSPHLQTVVNILDKDLNNHGPSASNHARERSASILSKTPQINQAKMVTNILLDPYNNGGSQSKRRLSRNLLQRESLKRSLDRRSELKYSDYQNLRFLPKNPPVRMSTTCAKPRNSISDNNVNVTNVDSSIKVSIDGKPKKLLNKVGKIYFVTDSENEKAEKGSERTADSYIELGGEELKKVHKGSKTFYISNEASPNVKVAEKRQFYCKEMKLSADEKTNENSITREESLQELLKKIKGKFYKSFDKYVESLCLLDSHSQYCKDALRQKQCVLDESFQNDSNKNQLKNESSNLDQRVDSDISNHPDSQREENSSKLQSEILNVNSKRVRCDTEESNTLEELENKLENEEKYNSYGNCKRKRFALNWKSGRKTFKCSDITINHDQG